MKRLTSSASNRRNDGRIRHPSSVNGRRYTTQDMVREYQRGKYARLRAEQIARQAEDKSGCFGVLLALLFGAGAIVGIAQQWIG